MKPYSHLLLRAAKTVIAAVVMLGWSASIGANLQTPSGDVCSERNPRKSSFVFIKNVGQWPDSVLFRTSYHGSVMWLMKDGIYFQYSRTVKCTDTGDPMRRGVSGPELTPEGHHSDSLQMIMVKAQFESANPQVRATGLYETGYKCNFYLGRDATKWRSDVPTYQGVEFAEIYPGVTVTLMGTDKGLESRIDGSTSAVAAVQMSYRGAPVVVQDDGTAIVETKFGDKRYAGVREVCEPVDGSRNRSKSISNGNVSLVYSTFLGGSSDEWGSAITVDVGGQAYATGNTASVDFPTVVANDGSYGGGYDAFVTKLSASGDSLIYSTYLGGGLEDDGTDIAIDKLGQVYVTGITTSSDFPIAAGYDSSYGGGFDAFITKLSAPDGSLIYSSFLGGSSADEGLAIAVDSAEQAFVAGWTRSGDFPTVTAYDSSYDAAGEAFVAKLSASGTSLIYSTFLGGSSDDLGTALAVDKAGQAYVTGWTISSDFPVIGAYDSSFNGGDYDLFVSKLSASGSSLIYSTYLGGISDDVSTAISLDGFGQAYVTGFTFSNDFPTVASYDGSFNGGGYDAFVTKLSASGSSLVYSTYLGGGDYDEGYSIAVDGEGHAHVTGATYSTNFPTVAAYDGSFNGGIYDAFVAELSATGAGLIYSTFLGGGGGDEGLGIALDGTGQSYVIGTTYSLNFLTISALNGSFEDTPDAFVTKLAAQPLNDSCCVDISGNVDCDPSQSVDIADLTALVDNLFISFAPLCCSSEANCDGAPGVDIGDLTALVDFLFINFTPLAACR